MTVIDRLLDREQERFKREHPRSFASWQEGQRHFLYGGPSHGMRRWAGGFPVYVDKAEGAHIRDVDGRDYVDFCLGDTGGMCGHMNEGILVTPFHTMFLMCPATTAEDVDRHTAVFGRFVTLLREAGVV